MIAYTSLENTSETFLKTTAVLGALIIVFSTLSIAEILKPLRWMNILFGAYLFVSSFLFLKSGTRVFFVEIALGLSFLGMTFPKGEIRNSSSKHLESEESLK